MRPACRDFLHWLESSDAVVKREPTAGGEDAVRIMSVHGAKGLQAPIVFLPDTTGLPPHGHPLVWSPDGSLVLRCFRSEERDPLASEWVAAARRRDLDEYRRLLYVAMTRAEDRLIVAGWRGARPVSAQAWYPMVRAALDDCAGVVREPADGGEDALLRLVGRADRRGGPGGDAAPARRGGGAAARLAAPRAARRRPPRAPRAGAGGGPRAGAGAGAARRADSSSPATLAGAAGRRRRGRSRARRIRRRTGARPCVFAPVFGACSVAEAAIGAAGSDTPAGRVDRLAVAGDAVLAVDFKTGGSAGDVADPPAAYLRQMAAYRGLLRAAFPGRSIRCALVWIDHARLVALDDARLARYAA